jgi:hypothetical protein
MRLVLGVGVGHWMGRDFESCQSSSHIILKLQSHHRFDVAVLFLFALICSLYRSFGDVILVQHWLLLSLSGSSLDEASSLSVNLIIIIIISSSSSSSIISIISIILIIIVFFIIGNLSCR